MFVLFTLLGELDPRACKYIFICYSSIKKGYECFDPYTEKVFISQDVVFDESHIFFSSKDQPQGENIVHDHSRFDVEVTSLPIMTDRINEHVVELADCTAVDPTPDAESLSSADPTVTALLATDPTIAAPSQSLHLHLSPLPCLFARALGSHSSLLDFATSPLITLLDFLFKIIFAITKFHLSFMFFYQILMLRKNLLPFLKPKVSGMSKCYERRARSSCQKSHLGYSYPA